MDPPGRPRRRAWLISSLAVLAAAAVVAAILVLHYRQTTRPLALILDNNADGSITRINTADGQEGQWLALYQQGHAFELALTFENFGNYAVALDDVALGDFNLGQGPLTYDDQPIQQILPANRRRPLHMTRIPSHGELTVVVPLHYTCAPANLGYGISTLVQAHVVWEMWGEHHSAWMRLPQPVLTTGSVCAHTGG